MIIDTETTPSTPRRSCLIVVEGIDGTGKSTLVRELAQALRAEGRTVETSAEPTKGPHGRRIRELAATGREEVTPRQETDLFIADRREHVAEVIAPAMAQGETIVLDRYYYSTMAYQGARGMDPGAIESEHVDFAPRPDLLVLLDMPVEDALRRVTHSRGSTPDHFEGADYLARVRELFLSFSHPNLLVLDARQPTANLVAHILERFSGNRPKNHTLRPRDGQ